MKKTAVMLLTLLMLFGSLPACGSLPNSVNDLYESEGDGVGYAVDGYANGYLGDTMHTAFFDFTINSAYTCMEFDGLAAEDGYKFLVAEITLYNNTRYTQPMYFYDFQIQWDAQEGEDEDEAYGYPLYQEVQDEDGGTDWVSVSDLQLPTFYELGINETRTGILLYIVPEGAKDYGIAFEESFESGETGDLFFVWFNAEEQPEGVG